MPNFTSRLGLTQPLTSEAYDIAVHNGNMALIDAAPANATICTSATRPSTPDDGDLIWETDTLNILIRHSSTWKLTVGRPHFCTAATRPSSSLSAPGMFIFETDTFRLLVRNAANTQWIFLTGTYVSALSDIPAPVDNQIAFSGANRAWWFRDPVSDAWTPPASGLVRTVDPATNSALTASINTVETNVNALDFVDVTLLNGHRYEFVYSLNLNTSVSGDVFDVLFRKGAAISGALIEFKRYASPAGGTFAPTATFRFHHTATADDTGADFRLSFVRSGGTGNILVYQDASMRNFAKMYYLGVPGQGIVVNS